MKTYSLTFLQTLNSETNALATCWLITLADGTTYGFTDFDRPLTIDGITYSPDGGFQPSDVDRGLDFSPNQISLKSYFTQALPESVFQSGQLRDARLFAFRVDPYNLPSSLDDDPLTYDPLIRGTFGRLTLTDQTYQAEVQGLQARLSTKQGWVTSPTCRNQFGDNLCGLDIADFTHNITVTGGTRNSFTIPTSQSENYYTGGRVVWQSGDNAGLETVVVYSSGTTIRILDKMPNTIQSGDTVTVERACDKTLAACWGFNNGLRFNGEPGIPGDNVGRIQAANTNPA